MIKFRAISGQKILNFIKFDNFENFDGLRLDEFNHKVSASFLIKSLPRIAYLNRDTIYKI